MFVQQSFVLNLNRIAMYGKKTKVVKTAQSC